MSTKQQDDAKRRPRNLWHLAIAVIVIALVVTAIAVVGARVVEEEDRRGGADEIEHLQVEPGDRRR